jgi:hypothetical protein
VVFAACGPIDYLNSVTRKASRAVANAKTSNAETLAPYEYWSALKYLEMAREKASYADFQMSNSYGKKAEKMALKAQKMAREKGEEGPGAKRNMSAPPEVVEDPAKAQPSNEKAPTPGSPLTPADQPTKQPAEGPDGTTPPAGGGA